MTGQEKIIYDILCSDEQPPEGQHWEGFVTNKIVAALAQPELGVTLTIAKHPVSLGIPSEYRLSKESLEDVVLEREWVGLTKDEVNNWELPELPTVYEFAKFVAARLKEKTNG